MKLLEKKRAIVTGGTSGIGKAIAICLARQGAHVAILGTNPDKAKIALAEIQQSVIDPSQQILVKLVDVSKTEDVEKAVEEIMQAWQGIDILVNNAGITRDALLMKMTEQDWDDVLSVNLKSVFNTSKAVIRPMIRQKYGKIINISSVIGLTGNIGQVNYAASKAGMIGFTKSLAQEVARKNICVNCVAPGYIQTDMTDKLPDTLKQQILEKIPMQRLGLPTDIANVVLFLASHLSDYMTAQVLSVDGGWVK